MDRKTITKEDFKTFVGVLMEEHGVCGVTRKGQHFVYDDLQSPDQLCLEADYVRTLLPPRKLCFPPKDEVIHFKSKGDLTFDAVVTVQPRVVIGLHPCDLHALQMLDLAMSSDRADERWSQRREALTLIGIDCLPDESCFCTSMRTNLPPAGGYDLFLTDVGDSYVIEVGSDRGKGLLSKAPNLNDATLDDLTKILAFRMRKEELVQQRLDANPDNLPLALTALRNSPVWEKWAEKCLACGSCNTTCATCFCFDVLDRMNLSLSEGVREKRWDGCLLPDFAKVASGENFRGKGVARYRHRFYRKFEYLPVRYGRNFCCGCGRCTVNCLADIANPVAVLNEVVNETDREERA